jgi:hypothetical protein
MGKFAEAKAELIKAAAPANGASPKRTKNKKLFNEIGTALLNDPDYQDTVYSEHNGEPTMIQTTPVRDLRKTMIGGIAKDAGLDAAETAKLIENHQFSTLPLYPVVGDMIEEFLDTGRVFAFGRREDLQGSIYIEEIKEPTTRSSLVPKQPGVKVTSVYDEHRRYRVKSKCPDNRKHKQA